ncbi:related to ribosomal protein S4 precursor, mitochondrial [Melanopsichium pennsylvanicum]|uniref:Related to ribosomal protein S4, mitochondrial n=2 Tax=Melanopsichium pennsylvanicum TaxID=63383 RepID=A0AAJ4XQE1_9BASI|nr:related to ribosomal protein S4 precursor, mitochondrial [Melanopsichium pennsylvanicum 4]SNX86403.1 related to ribosomal protein S4 precursor, mitochondrial [Melanopsichium pennsylvanicum]
MRKAKVFSHETILPRMSWSARNLYNTIARSTVPFHASQTTFTKTSLTMYQQRWRSKRFLRAYHGDWIPEKRFKRWFLPTELPSFVPPQVSASSSSASTSGPRKGGLFDKALQARRNPTSANQEAEAAKKQAAFASVTQQKVVEEMDAMPTASLFMRDVERRLDVAVFRSCFARSAYEARGMVVQGKVKINGVKINNPNTLLNPGDLIQVEPSAVPMLSKQLAAKAKAQKVNDEVSGEADAVEAVQKTNASEAAEAKEDAKEGVNDGEASDASEANPSSQAGSSETTEPKAAENGRDKVKQKEKVLPPGVHPFTLPNYAAPFLFIPPYLEVSFTTCSTIYVRHPTIVPYKSYQPSTNKSRWTFRTDLPSPFPAGGELYSMAWEHYTRNAPRTRADARRTKLEARVGRNGFQSQRAKDVDQKRSALRRGWGRTKPVSGWRKHLAAAQARRENASKPVARVVN